MSSTNDEMELERYLWWKCQAVLLATPAPTPGLFSIVRHRPGFYDRADCDGTLSDVIPATRGGRTVLSDHTGTAGTLPLSTKRYVGNTTDVFETHGVDVRLGFFNTFGLGAGTWNMKCEKVYSTEIHLIEHLLWYLKRVGTFDISKYMGEKHLGIVVGLYGADAYHFSRETGPRQTVRVDDTGSNPPTVFAVRVISVNVTPIPGSPHLATFKVVNSSKTTPRDPFLELSALTERTMKDVCPEALLPASAFGDFNGWSLLPAIDYVLDDSSAVRNVVLPREQVCRLVITDSPLLWRVALWLARAARSTLLA